MGSGLICTQALSVEAKIASGSATDSSATPHSSSAAAALLTGRRQAQQDIRAGLPARYYFYSGAELPNRSVESLRPPPFKKAP